MVQTSPSPFDVGRAFVHQYYTLLHQAPGMLYRFYSTDSTFIHGGVDRPGSMERAAVGPIEIARRINDLNLRDCHAKIRQVDSHPTIGNGVVVQVTGELSNDGQAMRRFMQTFVLAPRQPKKYYVQNDIFRYQDEVFDDGSDEDDRSSSQIYGDTDKVSNADSTAALTQQTLLLATTTRNVPEVEDQETQKPSPSQEITTPVQVISNQTVQTQETQLNGLNETTGYNGPQDTAHETQQPKQTTTEGTSYAGVAKLQPSTNAIINTNVISSLPVSIAPPTTTNRPTPPKSAPVRPVNQSRGSNSYPQKTSINPLEPNQTRRSGGHTSTVSNEQQVFVGSLPLNFTIEDLTECFSQFGNVIEAKIQKPMHDNKKNFGFISFDDPNVAASVVSKQHIMFKDIRLNVEPKTQKSYSGNGNNGPQGNSRNSYPPRGGNRGGNRGQYRGTGNPRRNGGGQHGTNSPSFTGRDENFKAQKQPQLQQ